MTDPAPLTFSDEQLVKALKSAPTEIQTSVALIAMQMELIERRAVELSDEE